MNRKVFVVVGALALLLVGWWSWRTQEAPATGAEAGRPAPASTEATRGQAGSTPAAQQPSSTAAAPLEGATGEQPSEAPTSTAVVDLENAGFISGFVELADGSPATQARVSAFGRDAAFTAETGPGGGFSLDVAPGAYQLSARQGDKVGSAGGRIMVGARMTIRDVRIRLGAAASLGGVVRSKDSGAPILGATVSVIPGSGKAAVARATSGADGRFEASSLAPGSYDVLVEARGFKALRRKGVTLLDGQHFELLAELLANGRIEGTVTDGAKKPLAAIQVIPQRKWGAMEAVTSTVTDAEGRFALEDLPPGDVYVAARRPGSEQDTRVATKVEPGQTAHVQLQLSDEGTLEGTVRLKDGGVPAKPVIVFLRQVDAPSSEGTKVSASAQGTFSVRVGAGRYQLSAWFVNSPGMSGQEQVVSVAAGQTQHVELEVREGKKPITVTVLEPNGAPSVHATVMGSEAGSSTVQLEEQTDESGRVTVMGDELGSDTLHLWAENGGRAGDLPRVQVASGAATIQLFAGGRLTGTVRSAGGRAVSSFQLVVAPVRGAEDYVIEQKFEFTGDRFSADDITPGRVTVTATLEDGRAGKAEAKVSPGVETHADITVEKGGRITGRLLDAKTGEPLAGAFVDVDGLKSPTTGADGRFQVEDLAPGAHRVTAWQRQHELVDKQVSITSGKTVDLGDWRLGPPRLEPGRLGLGFGMIGRDVTISSITPGAQVEDLQVGDVVVSIDGATVLTPGEARQRELGAPGSQVVLALRREGQGRTLTLTRAP